MYEHVPHTIYTLQNCRIVHKNVIWDAIILVYYVVHMFRLLQMNQRALEFWESGRLLNTSPSRNIYDI